MGGLAASLAGTGLRANQVIDLEWEDLLPQDAGSIRQVLRGVIEHEDASLAGQQPQSDAVRSDWNGQTIRLPGFIVPVEYSGTGVRSFILVPFVGACVHVPPPPPNQLVFVSTERPYPFDGLFEPVRVTGMFWAARTATELAEIAYVLSADQIDPYFL